MPKLNANLPVYNWVKNVYSLCTASGVTCAPIYTSSVNSPALTHQTSVQPNSFTQFVATFTQGSYTAFIHYFNLLNRHLYTLSTVPINTKTN